MFEAGEMRWLALGRGLAFRPASGWISAQRFDRFGVTGRVEVGAPGEDFRPIHVSDGTQMGRLDGVAQRQ